MNWCCVCVYVYVCVHSRPCRVSDGDVEERYTAAIPLGPFHADGHSCSVIWNMVQPALYDQSLPPMLSFCVAWRARRFSELTFLHFGQLTREFLLKPLLSSRLFSSCSCFTIFLLILSHFLFLISFCRSSLNFVSPFSVFIFFKENYLLCLVSFFSQFIIFYSFCFLIFFSFCIIYFPLVLSRLISSFLCFTSHRISFFPHFLFSFSFVLILSLFFFFFLHFIDLVFFSPIFLLCSTQWWSVTK